MYLSDDFFIEVSFVHFFKKIFAELKDIYTFAVPKRWEISEGPVGQGVKTPPFHGGITGSSPVRGTKSQSENESESEH